MSEVRKIALVHPAFKLSGGVKRMFTIAKLLRERGYEAVIYSNSRHMPAWSEHQDLEVRSLDASLRDAADCAIFFNPKHVPFRYLKRSPATHRVIYFLLNGGHYRRSYQRWINRTAHLPDVVLAGNNGRWRTHYDLKDKDDFDLIGGIDTDHFRPAANRSRNERFTILTQGRDRSSFKGKGTQQVIHELEGLADRVELVVFSNERVGYRSKRLALREVAAITPREMPSLYHSADLFVQNEDDSGGWSNTAAEAMACMTPVACTRFTTSDFAHHMKTSFVFERQPGAIREAVEFLLDRPDLLRAFAARGREEIERFSWERLIDQMEEMFLKLPSREPSPIRPRFPTVAQWIARRRA